ncbi:MAG TPA: PPC domain-containing protein [Acidimicrobiales bacterium]|nr:PPC domain-containing protein [Acidimicrobiales bacterium]
MGTRLGTKARRTALGAALLVLGSGITTVAARAVSPAINLGLGQSAFWNGAYVASAYTDLPGAAACQVEQCFDYPVKVAAGGWRLRVAIDIPDRTNEFELDLLDPSGTQQASVSNPGESQFDNELYVTHPVAGTWTVRVVPQMAQDSAFRLRAKLESGPVTYKQKTLLPPDLQVTPPYEFTFVAPANPANTAAPDSANPPLSVAGEAPLSCTPDETLNVGPTFVPGSYHPNRCLRFTTGPRDAGPGPFEIEYNPSAAGFGVTTPGQAFQRVYYSDGTSFLRPAGQFQFHAVHGHYHYLGFLKFQLYHVGATHALTPAGSGTKIGLCPADELFADWHNFNQENTTTFTANCGYQPGDATLGLNVGWGDVYRWQRPGQYVDFSRDGDGYYLLQVTVNASNLVLTVPHDQNVGYAYIHVVGNRVGIIERGQGNSPWDPARKVFTDQ